MAEGSAGDVSKIDYLIVGAGVSGLYCANELKKKGVDTMRMRVMERLNRTGGLLKSEIVEINGYKIKQEEGGMRFYKHHLVYELAVELGLEKEIMVFKMGGENNLNYVRGKRFTQSDRDEGIWFDVYNTENKGKNPKELINSVFSYIREINGDERAVVSPDDWQRVRLTWKVQDPNASDPNAKVPLYQWDYEYLLRQMGLDPEAIKMLQYSGGFRSLYNRDVNAGCGFQSNVGYSPPEASPDRTFYTLRHGYDQIIEELQKNLPESQVQLNSEVRSFDKDSKDFPIIVNYKECGVDKKIRCKCLILAIPKLALKKLSSYNPKLGEDINFNKSIDSVISRSMVKINLYFDHQWWAGLNITDGPNYTDLKLGSVYPFSPINVNTLKVGETLEKYPGSLTVYCDYENTIYWRSLQLSGGDYIPRVVSTCKLIQGLEDSVPASEMVVNVVMDQLKLLFKRPNIGVGSGLPIPPKDIKLEWPAMATFTHWTDEEFGDSIHAWKVGANDGAVSPAMYSLLGDNIAIIGESYSIAQGWVEGSLMHTNGFISQHVPIK